MAAGAALNRETTPVYVLSLEAMDEGDFPMSEAIMIRVVLEDVNDNSPEFTGTPYMTEVNEVSGVVSVVMVTLQQTRIWICTLWM